MNLESSHNFDKSGHYDHYYNRYDHYWNFHPKGNSFKEAANTVLSVKEHCSYIWYSQTQKDAKEEMTAYELTTDNACYISKRAAVGGVYPIWINCIARQFILIKTDFLELELKFNPLKTLVQEQQVKISIDGNLISGLQTTQQELLNRIESITLQNNLIQDSVDQKELLLQNAYDLINQKQATNEEQKAENTSLKRSLEEMNDIISNLKNEKIDCSNQIINLKSNFKIEKIEYKRRLKEFEDMNYFLLSELRKKAANSQPVSYATSDDEG
ncbi:MAG: hypothetical protein H0T62_01655 [Parachlamydiaceae bacterium]|nr:hypothetical protein [Parachlamydiaceae bacterium]